MALFGGVMYLWKSERRWDSLALASVEIGLVFLTMATVAGSVWGQTSLEYLVALESTPDLDHHCPAHLRRLFYAARRY
ncbi:MAG: hypothetical protein M5U34_22895 [Chloroflexi bacterium]|nr:hypothetical protein [Chloroflexota bacterium]